MVFPAVAGADGLAVGELAGAVGGERLLFGRSDLAAIDGQLGGGDLAGLVEAGEFGGETSGLDRSSLVVVAEAPQLRAGVLQ